MMLPLFFFFFFLNCNHDVPTVLIGKSGKMSGSLSTSFQKTELVPQQTPRWILEGKSTILNA